MSNPQLAAASTQPNRAERAASRPRLELSERRLLLVTGDIAAIAAGILSGLYAWSLRTELVFGRDLIQAQMVWIAIAFNAWLLWINLVDLYDLRVAVRRLPMLVRIIGGGCLISLTYLMYFFVRAIPMSSNAAVSVDPPLRLAPVAGIALSTILLCVWRMGYAQIWGAPHMRRRILILGAGYAGNTLVASIHGHAHVGAVCFVDDDVEKHGTMIQGVPVLGGHDRLLQIASTHQIDEIALAVSDNPSGSLMQAIMDCHERGIAITPMPLLYEQMTGKIAVEHIGSQWYVALPIGSGHPDTLFRWSKRILDVIVGLLAALVFVVLAPFLAIAIAIDSRGGVFYRQERVGMYGRVFTVVKFRTMRADAEKDGKARWASSGDQRITPIGRFLRKSRLDELPQVLNVLRGEMSIVGPRPERQQFIDELQKQIPFYRTRLAAKPGLTGWAQVNHGYGATVEDALVKLQYDLYYLKHQSPWFDLNIILRTVAVVLKMKGQ